MNKTVETILAEAGRLVGVHEVPYWHAPDGRTYRTNSGPMVYVIQQATPLKPKSGWPWCMATVAYVRKHAGVPLPYPTASVGLFRAWATAHGWKIPRPVPGAVVTFRFDHVGTVVSYDPRKQIVHTIEGNTSAGDSGSQSNGGGVYRRERHISLCDGFFLEPTLRGSDIPTINTWKPPKQKPVKVGTPKAKVVAKHPDGPEIKYRLRRRDNGLVYVEPLDRPH